jgi:hypothetical protein
MFVNGENLALKVPDKTDGEGLPINIDHPDFADTDGTELNGVIGSLEASVGGFNGNELNQIGHIRFDVPVVAGENTFKVIRADASDEELSRDYLLYGGWLEGFISAYNQFQQETYDVASGRQRKL